jgi:hypothetical protein
VQVGCFVKVASFAVLFTPNFNIRKLRPSSHIIVESIAQVFMALGDDFQAVKYAQQAVDLRSDWGEVSTTYHWLCNVGTHCSIRQAYLTLGRAQFNFGELDFAQDSFQQVWMILCDDLLLFSHPMHIKGGAPGL